jgi:alkylation response protein AidB-like acyl-CoA dehydrogenase
MNTLDLASIEATVQRYVEQNSALCYSPPLIEELARHGVFGAGVAPEFGGSALPPDESSRLTYVLARHWQAMAGLVGTHLKLCRLVASHGTKSQKERWLPAMAAGSMICARGYHEQGVTDPAFLSTRAQLLAGTAVLSGHKHWVTNARDADRIVIIARAGEATVGILIDPRGPGVEIGPDLPRAGMLGVSLAEIRLDQYAFDPDRDTIGGWQHDLTAAVTSHDVSTYTARAAAAADAVHGHVLKHVRKSLARRSPQAAGAITLRLGQLAVMRRVMHTAWHASTEAVLDHRVAKVFCTSVLQDYLAAAVPLCGGAGFAAEDATVARHYQDAIALTITGQPNDTLLTHLGEEEVGT